MRGEELAVAAPARPSGRDDVMASPPPPRRRWLLEGAGVVSTAPYAYEPGLIARLLGGGPRGHERLRCKVIAYMKNRVSFPLINSQRCSL
jgi:hypothetical protein